jgi:hypothetical protein
MSVDISEELVRAAADYVPDTTGHVVIAEGAGEDRAPAVAVWHVSPTGQPTGAWIRPVSMLDSDPEAARQLLFLTSHRALLAWDPATAVRSLDAIASWAHTARAPSLPTVRLPEVLKEIAEHRRAYEAVLSGCRLPSGRRPAPLMWRHDIPTSTTWEQFVAATHLRRPAAASPVASEALHLARAAAWAATRWHETVTTINRRPYLRSKNLQNSLLTPGWRDQLRAAHAHGTGGQ